MSAAVVERSAVGIVGQGPLGRALVAVVREQGPPPREVLVHEPLEADGADREGHVSLAELAARSRLIVLAVPAHATREVARKLGEVVDGAHLVVHTARGLEPETGQRMSEVLREETCVLRVGALAGPLMAVGLERGDPSACVVGSRYDDVIAEVKRSLTSNVLRVYGNLDLTGVELAAALGSALAFGAGVAAGLGFGATTRALLVTRGLSELARLGERLGAKERTFMGLAGVGARLAHAAAPPDDDFRFGELVGRGDSRPNEPDGARSARSAAALVSRLGVRAPLLIALRELLEAKRAPKEIGRELMVHASQDE